jgi:hypothetical protein
MLQDIEPVFHLNIMDQTIMNDECFFAQTIEGKISDNCLQNKNGCTVTF